MRIASFVFSFGYGQTVTTTGMDFFFLHLNTVVKGNKANIKTLNKCNFAENHDRVIQNRFQSMKQILLAKCT